MIPLPDLLEKAVMVATLAALVVADDVRTRLGYDSWFAAAPIDEHEGEAA